MDWLYGSSTYRASDLQIPIMIQFFASMSSIILFLLLSYSGLSQSIPTKSSKFIDSLRIETFFYKTATYNSLLYQDVYKEAKSLFKENKYLYLAHFRKYFKPWVFGSKRSKQRSDQTQYLIFNGSDGIIGQAIVLIVSNKGQIENLDIVGWGR